MTLSRTNQIAQTAKATSSVPTAASAMEVEQPHREKLFAEVVAEVRDYASGRCDRQ